ncbi:DUF1338 domain-containing protein [uncultured Polaribacter sp.]|uniref:DUF1338 domain-containing protein n=1 Tax=uncultured Polaribacter sp. TaxID=174711 RepID=UPI0026209CB1|nr:DUF1338 domain-containing protein [uncultured Polaribacter sp.]
MKTLDKVLKGLMSRYQERVPDVLKITTALVENNIISKQEDIENDHIAFRTMGVANLGIASFEKIFLHYGYTKEDAYFFKTKKLNAHWYKPPNDKYPRIFISELQVTSFSEEIQKIIKSYTDEVTLDPVDSLNLDNADEVDRYLHAALWRIPTLEDYSKLMEVSEYAAWVIYNRYYLNHYTITVNSLPKGYNTLAEFNMFLNNIDVKLSDAGGYIKTSRDGLLLQSATISQLCNAEFAEGITKKIAGSYVEFAERKILPEFRHLPENKIERKHRREGFETANADKIFESTFTSQTNKKGSD